jgi:hypothetical protein
MTVYLDADCALDALISDNFMKPENWKRLHSEKYIARFWHGLTNGTLSFEVSVKDNIHRISSIYIENLERLYNVKLSHIFDKCSIAKRN